VERIQVEYEERYRVVKEGIEGARDRKSMASAREKRAIEREVKERLREDKRKVEEEIMRRMEER
jgi:hypothetical protein